MVDFKIGDKLILKHDFLEYKAGTVVEIASMEHYPENIGIRFPDQDKQTWFPNHRIENYMLPTKLHKALG